MSRLFKIQHPEVFQGNFDKSPYFEGWYCKIVDKTKKYVMAFIFAISIDKKGGTSHSFIQFFNGTITRADYLKFPVEAFAASTKVLDVRIQENQLTLNTMQVDLNYEDQRVKGKLDFKDVILLPKEGIGHGIMGIFAYVPFLECHHGLVALNFSLEGSIILNNQEIDFSGGRGYIEKDWGTNFPVGYTWMQCNNFNKIDTSVFASIALVPSFGRIFLAYIAFILLDGKVYRFAIYRGDKLKVYQLEANLIKFEIENKKYKLEIIGLKTPGMDLPSPTRKGMNATISESLTSKLQVKFSQKKKFQEILLFEGEGEPAGLEIQLKPDQIANNMI